MAKEKLPESPAPAAEEPAPAASRKVKALRRISHNGVIYKPGETFTVSTGKGVLEALLAVQAVEKA
jgi:hypothetical protein